MSKVEDKEFRSMGRKAIAFTSLAFVIITVSIGLASDQWSPLLGSMFGMLATWSMFEIIVRI